MDALARDVDHSALTDVLLFTVSAELLQKHGHEHVAEQLRLRARATARRAIGYMVTA